jgi:acyl-CoA dehydrogenase
MRKGESVRAQEDGFMLAADNLNDPKQSELMIDWCAGVLDTGSLGSR